jgi:hypothetical protein
VPGGVFRHPRPDTRDPVTLRGVSEEQQGFRDRLSRQGEETLGKLAEELLGNPMVAGALQRAFEAREKAAHAQ